MMPELGCAASSASGSNVCIPGGRRIGWRRFPHLILLAVALILLGLCPMIAAESSSDESCVTQNDDDQDDRPLKVLFVHQNFPGQFKHLAPALVRQGHSVTALHMRKGMENQESWKGVKLVHYTTADATRKGSTPGVHPWLVDLETKIIRGEACMMAAQKLKEEGLSLPPEEGEEENYHYSPDVIVAHPGWGEPLFLREVWPHAKIGIFCEFYYGAAGRDTGFDAEFSSLEGDECAACRFKVKNMYNHMQDMDGAVSPTEWQAGTYPREIRDKITVIFDGIDTSALVPDPTVSTQLTLKRTGEKLTLTRDNSEVISFVTRNLEPMRGYHIFMRALPEILNRRPNARVMIVGGSEKGYGSMPGDDEAKYGVHKTWKEVFIAEVRNQISDDDWDRVHFLGKLPHSTLNQLMQLSSVHVYWTYPFVMSWSLIEAMSVGCAIVASDTAPVREAIVHGETGQLVDFFDVGGMVKEICDLLDRPDERARLGANARRSAVEKYDLKSVCLPRQLEWVKRLAAGRNIAGERATEEGSSLDWGWRETVTKQT